MIGGLVTFYVALSQACLLAWIIIGFLVSKYILSFPFFSPVALCVLGTFELLVLSGTGRMLHREESKLISDLLALLHPWTEEYGIVAKMRKSRGKFRVGDNGKEKSITCYCIVLEKITPGLDIGTVSLSSFTDIESDDENVDVEEGMVSNEVSATNQ
ncbi:hypothetical protein ACHAWO_005454 [Cyclotella atomus]|uniref:Uncharacterized protein n=1 Tax=Cyclotella atomus TaxID=382360 RepID=A0ABD3QWI1_9STRA